MKGSRNPIAKAVKKIRPHVLPGKDKPSGKFRPEDIRELHEYASKQLDKNARRK